MLCVGHLLIGIGWARLLLVVALLLLLLLELLLLFELLLHSLEASHHTTLLLGLLLSLSIVSFELYEELVLVYNSTQYHHDDDRGER